MSFVNPLSYSDKYSLNYSRDAAKSRRSSSGPHDSQIGELSNVNRVVLCLAAIVGLGIASYLSWASLTASKVAGCGSGQIFDCGHVLNSKWSNVSGIPVGLLAVFAYVTALAAIVGEWLAPREIVRSASRTVLYIVAISAGFAAIWFISLQIFVVKHFCQYCLVAHGCSLVIAGIVVWRLKLSAKQVTACSLFALLSVATLAVVQANAAEPEKFKVEHHAAQAAASSVGQFPDSESENTAVVFDSPGQAAEADSDAGLFAAPGTDR